MAERNPARVLVTGFGPFPGVPHNPTADLIGWLEDGGAAHCRGAEITTAVLPVQWQAGATRMLDLLQAHAPDVLLQFGASRRATGFRVEQWARNRTSFHPDAGGQRAPGHEVRAGAPRTLRASLPAPRLVIQLQGLGLPAIASTDAGGYLCNAMYFLSLEHIQRSRWPTLCQFVHIPAELAADGPAPEPLTWAGLRKGALALIQTLAASARRTGGKV